jgi:hypothetical protein
MTAHDLGAILDLIREAQVCARLAESDPDRADELRMRMAALCDEGALRLAKCAWETRGSWTT